MTNSALIKSHPSLMRNLQLSHIRMQGIEYIIPFFRHQYTGDGQQEAFLFLHKEISCLLCAGQLIAAVPAFGEFIQCNDLRFEGSWNG